MVGKRTSDIYKNKAKHNHHIHGTEGLKLLKMLRLLLNHLGDYKFRHNFQQYTSHMCTCSRDIERTSHFLRKHQS